MIYLSDMEVKKKKCKGTSKAKGYGCGELCYTHKYGLCKNCFKNWLFNTPEGNETLKKSAITGKNKVKADRKKAHVKLKNESKSIAKLIQETRMPFQKLIRIRDHGKKCICCDKNLPFNIGDYDGGHYKTAEMYSGTIFHPDNCHGQTVYCNKYNHGNGANYSDKLRKRIGIYEFSRLLINAKEFKDYKWSREELNRMKKHYNKELREVEKGLKNIKDVDFTIGILNT